VLLCRVPPSPSLNSGAILSPLVTTRDSACLNRSAISLSEAGEIGSGVLLFKLVIETHYHILAV
jgi:hypothetical protein